jgi:hypothetical protein
VNKSTQSVMKVGIKRERETKKWQSLLCSFHCLVFFNMNYASRKKKNENKTKH